MTIFSFVTVCFGRPEDFNDQNNWFKKWSSDDRHFDCFERVVICDKNSRLRQSDESLARNIVLVEADVGSAQNDIPCFNKSALFNEAAEICRGKYIIPLDVDLLPLFPIDRIIELANKIDCFILSGYRLNVRRNEIQNHADDATLEICPEDRPSALHKQLSSGEQFGVCPIFNKEIFRSVGGYDEKFVGWGAEDQDLIERISDIQGPLMRVPLYLWLHIDHERHQGGWYAQSLTEKNRQYYYYKRDMRRESNNYISNKWRII